MGESDRAGGEFDPFLYSESLAKLTAYVQGNLCGDVSATRAAMVVNRERRYFSKWFRARTGLRYSHWVRQLRVERGLRMLRTHDYSVSEVAFAVGYDRMGSFCEATRAVAGITPSEFKRRFVTMWMTKARK
jgi:transcriptional regulator GlxA family with amidase domain